MPFLLFHSLPRFFPYSSAFTVHTHRLSYSVANTKSHAFRHALVELELLSLLSTGHQLAAVAGLGAREAPPSQRRRNCGLGCGAVPAAAEVRAEGERQKQRERERERTEESIVDAYVRIENVRKRAFDVFRLLRGGYWLLLS